MIRYDGFVITGLSNSNVRRQNHAPIGPGADGETDEESSHLCGCDGLTTRGQRMLSTSTPSALIVMIGFNQSRASWMASYFPRIGGGIRGFSLSRTERACTVTTKPFPPRITATTIKHVRIYDLSHQKQIWSSGLTACVERRDFQRSESNRVLVRFASTMASLSTTETSSTIDSPSAHPAPSTLSRP